MQDVQRCCDGISRSMFENHQDNCLVHLIDICRVLNEEPEEKSEFNSLFSSTGFNEIMWHCLFGVARKEIFMNNKKCVLQLRNCIRILQRWYTCPRKEAVKLISNANVPGSIKEMLLSSIDKIHDTSLFLLMAENCNCDSDALASLSCFSCCDNSLGIHLMTLADASISVESKPSSSSSPVILFRHLLSPRTNGTMALEPGGRAMVPNALFTLLNKLPSGDTSFKFKPGQVLSCMMFSSIYSWLSTCAVPRDSVDIVMAYCLRVVQQISSCLAPWNLRLHHRKEVVMDSANSVLFEIRNLHWSSTLSAFNFSVDFSAQGLWHDVYGFFEDSNVESISYEVIRILDLVCHLDKELVPVSEKLEWISF